MLLNLGTARQYLGQRDLAQNLFREGLVLAQLYAIPDHDNFFYHHQGRCHAEQGNIGEARQCFERALKLRRQLGDEQRAARTQAALDALAELER